MEIKLVIFIMIYVATLTYIQFKKNIEQLILDLISILLIPIGLTIKIFQIIKKKLK